MSRATYAFWILVTAAVVFVGALSTAVRLPPSPGARVLTAVTGAASATSVALAGRILLVVTRTRRDGRRRAPDKTGT